MSKEDQQLFKGIFEGADLRGTQINFVTGEHAKVVYQEIKDSSAHHHHFPYHQNKDEGVRLYDSLTNEGFIEGALDNWLFLMGFIEQEPVKIKAIIWKGTKEQLRVMLRMLFEELINKKEIKVAELASLTPECFIDINGKPMELANAKEEISFKMDRLKKIFRPFPDQ